LDSSESRRIFASRKRTNTNTNINKQIFTIMATFDITQWGTFPVCNITADVTRKKDLIKVSVTGSRYGRESSYSFRYKILKGSCKISITQKDDIYQLLYKSARKFCFIVCSATTEQAAESLETEELFIG
jgi:hypothetical protein